MKKILCTLACIFAFFALPSAVSAGIKTEFGLGSGYVFYGDDDLRDFLSDFGSSSQVILCGDCMLDIPLADSVTFIFGLDSILDARWKGSDSVILWDYCGFAGFNIYPGLAGLYGTAGYCVGRRTDFFNLTEAENTIKNTSFGNGFAFGLGYDFGYSKLHFAPQLSASWRHIPRGGSSDDILEIKFRIKK